MTEILSWVPFLLATLLFAGAIIAEVMWLVKKGWATAGTAAAFVLLTDLIGFGIGTLVVVVIFTVMFMMVMGPAGRGSNVPEIAYVVTTAFAAILPPSFLIILKRLFLMIFKIRAGKPAWIFSVVASILVIFITAVPPIAIFVAAAYLPSWK